MLTYPQHIVTFEILLATENLATDRVQGIIAGVCVFFENLSLQEELHVHQSISNIHQ